MNRTLVLDAGALIAVERRISRMQALLSQARAHQVSFLVPTVVVAQVMRSGGRQVNLRRFLADPYLAFAGVDYPTALKIGTLLGDSDTADVVDACVVIHARSLGRCPVVTSDPEDLSKLDSSVPLIVI